MISEESKNEQLDFGFAGLSSMVSDIETTVKIAQAKRLSTNTPSVENYSELKPIRETESSSEPIWQNSTQASWINRLEAKRLAIKWLSAMFSTKGLIVGWIVVMFFNCLWQTDSLETQNTGSGLKNNTISSTTPLTPTPTWSPQTPELPTTTNRPSEEKPQVGTRNIFGTAQIRWCLAEDIRIEAARTIINDHVASNVKRFNEMVANYNHRCSNFRYLRSNLESAKSYTESYRTVIEFEGYALFSAGAIKFNSSNKQSLLSETVREIQKNLIQLGYDAGSLDGVIGLKTKQSILQFQRDEGINIDGFANKILLKRLRLAKLKKNRLKYIEIF